MTMFGRHGDVYLYREREIVSGNYRKQRMLKQAINAGSMIATVTLAALAIGAAFLISGQRLDDHLFADLNDAIAW